MKHLITILTLTLSVNSFSHELPKCELPHKKHATSKPRCNITNVQPVIEHQYFSYRTVTMPPKANRLFILAGYGPNGVRSLTTGSTITYQPYYGLITGVGYERVIDNEASDSLIVGVDVLINNSVLFKVGRDF